MSANIQNKNLSRDNQTRVDRNLLVNFEGFKVLENPNLAWDLLVYQSVHQQEKQLDMFGRNILDPYDFANKMGRHVCDLHRKVRCPKTNEILPAHTEAFGDKKYQFDTVLEHCIVNMNRINIPMTKAWTLNKDEDIVSFKAIQLIKSFDIIIEKGTNKRKYVIEWYDHQIEALAKKFAHFFYGNIAEIRRSNAYGLYNYLIDLRLTNQWNKTNGTPNFNLLCKKMNLNSSNNSYKKNKLEKIFRIINQETSVKFDWEFIAPKGMRHKFQPVIKWKNDPISLNPLEIRTQNSEYLPILFDEYHRKVYRDWKKRIKNSFEKNTSWKKWYHSKICISEKVLCFIKAYNFIFKKQIDFESEVLINFFNKEHQKDWPKIAKETIKNEKTESLLVDIPKHLKTLSSIA